MAAPPDIARANGQKGGRPKGSKNHSTLEKEAAREHARKRITDELDPILDAALQRAKGISYLVTRDVKTGKFVRVTRGNLKSIETAIEVWEKEPDMAAIRELLDRCLDKSKEQVMDVNVHQDWEKLAARITAARLRVEKKAKR